METETEEPEVAETAPTEDVYGDIDLDTVEPIDEPITQEEEAGEGESSEGDALDMDAITREILSASSAPEAGRDSWRGEAKAKLVGQGWDEKTAHQLAYHGKVEKVQAMLAESGKSGQPMDANPTQAPPVDAEMGARLTEALSGILDDSEAAQTLSDAISRAQSPQIETMAGEIRFLRSQLVDQQAGKGASELVAARDRNRGAYPEVDDPAAWTKLSPAISAAMQSGLAPTLEKALDLVLFNEYGPRSGESVSKPDSPSPVPTRPGKQTPGARALTQKQIQSKVSQMIFDGRHTEAQILRWKRDAEARLK